MQKEHDELIALRTGKVLPENSGIPWSEQEQDTLSRLFWTGFGISEIAIFLQRNELAICQQLMQRGMFSQQGKPRTRKEKTEDECHCAHCANKDCSRCGEEKPDDGVI